MKKYGHKYTPQEIEGFRRFFAEMNWPEVRSEIDGHKFSYMVVPRTLNEEVPDLVLSYVGDCLGLYIICVSESITPEFRKYAAFHEYVEFIRPGVLGKDKCRSALERELSTVPGDKLTEYASMRRDFFSDLIKYASRHAELFKESDIDGFRSSLSLLEQIVK